MWVTREHVDVLDCRIGHLIGINGHGNKRLPKLRYLVRERDNQCYITSSAIPKDTEGSSSSFPTICFVTIGESSRQGRHKEQGKDRMQEGEEGREGHIEHRIEQGGEEKKRDGDGKA